MFVLFDVVWNSHETHAALAVPEFSEKESTFIRWLVIVYIVSSSHTFSPCLTHIHCYFLLPANMQQNRLKIQHTNFSVWPSLIDRNRWAFVAIDDGWLFGDGEWNKKQTFHELFISVCFSTHCRLLMSLLLSRIYENKIVNFLTPFLCVESVSKGA